MATSPYTGSADEITPRSRTLPFSSNGGGREKQAAWASRGVLHRPAKPIPSRSKREAFQKLLMLNKRCGGMIA